MPTASAWHLILWRVSEEIYHLLWYAYTRDSHTLEPDTSAWHEIFCRVAEETYHVLWWCVYTRDSHTLEPDTSVRHLIFCRVLKSTYDLLWCVYTHNSDTLEPNALPPQKSPTFPQKSPIWQKSPLPQKSPIWECLFPKDLGRALCCRTSEFLVYKHHSRVQCSSWNVVFLQGN